MSSQKTLDFGATLDVNYRDVAAEAIGDVQKLTVRIGHDTGRFESGGKSLDDLPGRRVDHRNRVGPGVGDVEAAAIRSERDSAWNPADGNFARDLAGGHIDYANFIAVLADNVKLAAIFGKRHFNGREIAFSGKRHSLLRSRPGRDSQQSDGDDAYHFGDQAKTRLGLSARRHLGLLHSENAIDRQVLENLLLAAGPVDRQFVGFIGCA